MQIIKKTYSKNNNEIVLIEKTIKIKDVESTGLQNIATRIFTPHPFPLTVLIIGVFHGDEPQGKSLIEDYLNKTSQDSKNRLLFIPCLNPDGMINNTRQNANMVDLNRNFPTKNWVLGERNEYFGGDSPASEAETKFVIEIIEEYKPDVILTLHAPYMVVNYDGPAKEIAEEISKLINYPAESDIGYPTPGSFGNYAGIEKNIPTITLELDEKTDLANLTKPVFDIFNYLSNFN